MAHTAICWTCSRRFEAKRSTAMFCGGTCRQRWNRKQKRTPGTPANLNAEIKAGIDGIHRAVQTFTSQYKLGDLAGVDYTALEEALETLDALFDCEDCEERKADGWENIEYCRKCEIEIFELVCGQCEKRKPSVKSDEQLCARCAKGE